MAAAASLAGLSPAFGGQTLPTTGTVTSGTATIGAPTNGALTITQTSDKAIISWQGFSVGPANSVTFNNGSGATLNRVTGNAPSNIGGALNATGSVFLINPNGIVVGKSGVVNVGKNFVASTLNTSDAAFNAGGSLTLSGTSNAQVINEGKIGSLGGDVALVGQQTLNAGTISAPNGSAGVLSGTQVTLRDSTLDDGKFSVDSGTPTDSVGNTGNIAAAEAELKANGGNIYALAGNTSGVISATGISGNDGKVFLTAGDTGSVTANATISAQTSSGTGGDVETSGGKVNFDGLHVAAGDWLIDPVDLDIDSTAAATISTALATTSVTIRTTATGTNSSLSAGTIVNPGNGDINDNADITWASGKTLTLSAYRHVNLNANITSTGGGNVNLISDNTGTGNGTVTIGGSDVISTSGTISLYYNPTSYTAPTNYTASITGGATFLPYMLVNNLTELQAINTNTSANYALGRDIDASATSGWNSGQGFAPVIAAAFDGQGHTISNLFIDRPTQGAALFLNVHGLANLNVTNANITGSGAAVAAGNVFGGISNVSVSGSVTAVTNGAGGLVVSWSPNNGVPGGDEFINSTANVTVTGAGNGIGGLAGSLSSISGGTISNDSAFGNVTGGASSQNVGGFAGTISGPSVTSSSASGNVWAGASSQDVGGFVGSGGAISQSSATGSVTGHRFVGGFAGAGGGSDDTASGGTVTGDLDVGGFAGLNEGSMSNSSADDAVFELTSGTGQNIGGFVGVNTGTITSSDATGSVRGNNSVGGFAGLSDGTLDTVTASGNVTGADGAAASTDIGGLVGQNINDGGPGIPDFGQISFALATGNVRGSINVGGAIGVNLAAVVDHLGATGTVSGATSVGGLVGLSSDYDRGDGDNTSGSITKSFATGDVVATGSNAGGLIGMQSGATVTSNDWAGGNVTGATNVGGFIGEGGGITNSYAIGAVTATSATGVAGGFVGQAVLGMSAVYATGLVTGHTTGGLAGAGGGISGSYWDSFTTGQASPGTAITATAVSANTGTAYSSSSYSTFNFTQGSGTWYIINGRTRPFLQSEVWATGGNSAIIVNAHQLQLIDLFQNVNFSLIGDAVIDASGTAASLSTPSSNMWGPHGFSPIPNYAGTFNGNGGSIDSLTIYNPVTPQGIGMFVNLASNAVIEDLTLGNVDVVSSTLLPIGSGEGGLAGKSSGTIEGVAVTGTVSGVEAVGGLVGFNRGTIEAFSSPGNEAVPSSFDGSVSGRDELGGLVGENFETNGKILGSASSGSVMETISGGDYAGGLVGLDEGTVLGSSSSSAVTGTSDVGGLIGGFLSVDFEEFVTDSYATGAVSGQTDVGGLAGSAGGTIENSYASGAVLGTKYVGGLVGFSQQTTVTDTYALGRVTESDAVNSQGAGGLIGNATTTTVSYSYASGKVASTTGNGVGGLIGMNTGSADTVTNAHWDEDTTGQASAGAPVTSGATPVGIISTGHDAYSPSGYANLSDGNWLFVSGARPMLAMEYSTLITNAHQLQLIATAPSADYWLAHDVDLSATQGAADVWSSAGFIPIANFSGVFDGSGFTLEDLYENRPALSMQGLFRTIGVSGSVENVTLSNSNVTGLNNTGALAGQNSGYVNDVVILGGQVHGARYIGGIAGANLTGATIAGSSSSATVTGSADRVGGLIGWNAYQAFMTDDLATGHTIGVDEVGGLIGWNDGQVSNSGATGEVTGSDYAAGGLVGYNTGVGYVTIVYATGSVDGNAGSEGGLIGANKGGVLYAYATGSVGVATTHTAGGLIGNNSGLVTQVYAAGVVHGATSATGALYGANTGGVDKGYYDTFVTGGMPSIGNNYNHTVDPHPLNASHPPTAQSSYVGFDFSIIWTIASGQLPTLRNVP